MLKSSDQDFNDLGEIWSRLNHDDQDMVLMWRAVLTQAVRDLGSSDPDIAYDSVIWFGTPDYETVCELALVNGDALHQTVKDVLGMQSQLYRQKLSKDIADQLRSQAMTLADRMTGFEHDSEEDHSQT
jgi:hypothetical protein